MRNLGAPVDLAGRYFMEGADEVTFLNITGFRDFPLGDLPMLEVGAPSAILENASSFCVYEIQAEAWVRRVRKE